MYCKKCGQYMDDHSQFCPNCGANQQEQNAGPVYQAAPVQPAPSVNILEATKLFFTRYADFSGRSRRSEFWWAQLSLYIIAALITAIGSHVEFLGWIPQIWSLVILVPGIAITVRRLHDAGHKGTYYLWNFLPIIGNIMVLVQCCKDSVPANQWGPNPKGY